MLFLVKHIDRRGHRFVCRVSAVSRDDAQDQVERELGPGLGGSVFRLETRGGLRLVPSVRQPQGRRP